MGNIIKDTLYDYHDYWEYLSGPEGGHLYKDKNGGYFHFGVVNQIIVPSDLGSNYNFTEYFAHLDTNFRIDWIRKFPYSDTFGKRFISRISQLLDSNYILYGSSLVDSVLHPTGWIAKIDKHGNILWQRTYLSDTLNDCYIEDLIEKPDGSMVFVGTTGNDTLPSWHHWDVWLVGLDSNGCDVGGCNIPTRLPAVSALPEVFSIFPNPTTGNITISAIEGGVFALYSMDGRGVFECAVGKGNTEVRLPAYLSKGLYFGRFVGNDGGLAVKRVVID